MTIMSLADCCRHLSIDPKTLRRWLAQAPFTAQPYPHHPHERRRHGLTEDQLRWLATAHHRSLPALPQQPPVPLPGELEAVPAALLDLPEQLDAL